MRYPLALALLALASHAQTFELATVKLDKRPLPVTGGGNSNLPPPPPPQPKPSPPSQARKKNKTPSSAAPPSLPSGTIQPGAGR